MSVQIKMGDHINESPQIVGRVNALLDNKDRMNSWMCDFLDSITRQIQQGRNLSIKQRGIVDREWAELPDDIRADYPEGLVKDIITGEYH